MGFKSFLAILLVFFIPLCAAKEKVYLIGVEAIDYYPLYSFDRNGIIKESFTQELLQRFFKKYQIKFKFVPLPVKRVNSWYLDHNLDFKFPDNHRWRDEKTQHLGINYSKPVIKLLAGTYVKNLNETINRKDINSILTIRGFSPSLWMKDIQRNKVKIHEESTPLAIVKHILAGNYVGTNIDVNVINYNLGLLRRENEVVLAKNVHHEEFYYHLSSIQHPDIIKKFDEFLINQQVFIKALKKKYQLQE